MACKQITLHIGLSKTGTSSIQNYMRDNSNILNSLDINVYLNSDWPHGLAKAIISDDEQFLSEFKKLLQQEQKSHVIISSEYFEFISREKISKLKTFFSEYKVTVVAYLKRQDQAIVSMYNEEVKKGVTLLNFKNYCDENWQRFDYSNLVGNWAEFFGKDNVLIRPFQKRVFLNENLIDDFLGVIGVNLESDSNTPSVNVSVSRLALELTRVFYLAGQQRYDHQTEYAEAIKLSYQIDSILLEELALSELKNSYFDNQTDLIEYYQHFEQSNAELNTYSEGFNSYFELVDSEVKKGLNKALLFKALEAVKAAELVSLAVIAKAKEIIAKSY